MDKEKLGAFLRHARESCSLNQTQLAEQIGYSINSVSRWEQGKQAITVEALVSILEVTHLQVTLGAVSYTHLDVYKRQVWKRSTRIWRLR